MIYWLMSDLLQKTIDLIKDEFKRSDDAQEPYKPEIPMTALMKMGFSPGEANNWMDRAEEHLGLWFDDRMHEQAEKYGSK
jgi:Holliday junction resolvasome RuvABC DNA-binding subunit